jgi:transposase InsO family protein
MDQLREGLQRFFHKYNTRSHQGLGRQSPQEVYRKRSTRAAHPSL